MRMRVIDGYCVKNWCCDTTKFGAQCGILQSPGIAMCTFSMSRKARRSRIILSRTLFATKIKQHIDLSNPGIVSLPFDVPSWELSVWFPADSSRFGVHGVLTIGNTGIQELSVGENHIGDLAATYLAEAFGEAVSRCQVSKSLILPRRGLYLRFLRYSAKSTAFRFQTASIVDCVATVRLARFQIHRC